MDVGVRARNSVSLNLAVKTTGKCPGCRKRPSNSDSSGILTDFSRHGRKSVNGGLFF